VKAAAPFFLSYAHADRDDVERFRAVMEPLFRGSARYEFGGWSDHLILPGEQWREEIDAALKSCRFGLLLVSPEFLTRPVITGVELPALLGKSVVVPVCLKKVPLDGSIELKGLAERQFFHDSKGRCFDRCGTRERRDFALELFGKIGKLLEKYPC